MQIIRKHTIFLTPEEEKQVMAVADLIDKIVTELHIDECTNSDGDVIELHNGDNLTDWFFDNADFQCDVEEED